MRSVVLISTVCLCVQAVNGQEQEEPDYQYVTEQLLPYADGDAEPEDMHENLLQILSSPYDLNVVTKEELQLLHILTDSQIANFLKYREKEGPLVDIHELQVVSGFDADVIRRLMPFVTVIDPTTRVNRSLTRRMFSNDNMYVVSRYERTLQKKKGYISSAGGVAPPFAGSPDKMYLRFRSSQPGDFSFGFTGEKDAGEKFMLRPRSQPLGFDFTSWHLQLRNKGRIRNIIAGDFQTQFAQGLMLGGAFGLGKGAETTSTTRRSNAGFLPYTSINEGAYLRGIAITLGLSRNTSISMFYSHAKRDATSDSLDGGIITSISTTGYHRTIAEIARRKKITEQNCGLVAAYQNSHVDAGILANLTQFDAFVRREKTLYNQYSFSGTYNLNYGLFLNYTISNVSFFSEAVQTAGAGRAFVAGVLVSLHKRLELAILQRNYMADYHTFYANAFSENTQPQNEWGSYWGWKYGYNRQVTINSYVDLFAFPWLGFRRYRPSAGYEWLLRVNYQPSKNALMFIQLRQEVKERNSSPLDPLYNVVQGTRRNLVLHIDYGIIEKIRLKLRTQYNAYQQDQGVTEGLVAMMDVNIKAGRFHLAGRHALFETDHHDNRQYVYENDAWLSYSLPAYSGVGVRNYALIEFKVHNNLTVWFRYARTRLIDVTEIGTGPEAIAGNTKNDVKFQARLKF